MGRQVCVRVPAGTVPGTWYGNWGHGSVIGVYGVQVHSFWLVPTRFSTRVKSLYFLIRVLFYL